MKLKIPFALLLALVVSCTVFGQRARIVIEAMTPHRLVSMEMTTNVSSGLNVVPNDAYAYISAENIGNSEAVNSATYEIISKPSGSNTTIESVNNGLWSQFKPDVPGTYVVKLTINTTSGVDDTTTTFYSANYVGVGNYDGVRREFPNCMTCHENTPKFQDIFARWEKSGHATAFKRKIDESNSHFSTNCIKCHVTGYIPDAENNGFDDVAEELGWSLGTPGPGKWDSLKTYYTALSQVGTIGCESCHGPGSEHVFTGQDPAKVGMSIKAGNCGQCHDEPWRHNKYAQFENSLHAEAIWSNSFAQGATSQNNSLNNCIRCHDGNGFINFTKGKTTNTTGMTRYMQEHITCATCHDPHGNDNVAQVRYTPAGSDTLGNGFKYKETYNVGIGEVCMNCHKARRDNVAYMSTAISATWGPHHSVQSDVLLGQNAAQFDEVAYKTSPHKWVVENSCVGCHMSETVAVTDTLNRDKVGGHSWKMSNPETGYDHTASCVRCHGDKESFEAFESKSDHDGDGVKESVEHEIEGLTAQLVRLLPPAGVDSISWQAIKDANDPIINKAYWNYQLIAYDGSKGMHNAVFAIDVLKKSIKALGGTVTDVELDENPNFAPSVYTLKQNYPNPFNPTTTIQYGLPFESQVRIAVYNIAGELVQELVNTTQNAGSHDITFNFNSNRQLSSGVYFYQIEARSLQGNQTFRQTKKMVLLK